jgi:hypothetical protein
MADNLTTFMCRLSRNLGASTSWNPKGLSRPVMELLYFFFKPLFVLTPPPPPTKFVRPDKLIKTWKVKTSKC